MDSDISHDDYAMDCWNIHRNETHDGIVQHSESGSALDESSWVFMSIAPSHSSNESMDFSVDAEPNERRECMQDSTKVQGD